MVPFFLIPISFVALVEEVKRELDTSDKALAIDFGLRDSDYSGAKHGRRAFAFGRVLAAPVRIQWAFLRAWRKALVAYDLPSAPAQLPDADLLDDIAIKLSQLRTRMVRAELRDVTDERKRA